VAGQWFSVGTPVSHTYKTDYHNINDTRQQIIPICCLFYAREIKIIGAQLQFLEMKMQIWLVSVMWTHQDVAYLLKEETC
jgi:hypothetical protein